MSDKKNLFKNTGLIAIGNMGAKAMSLILLPLYTSILTTEEYGIYDYIVAICAFLIPIVTFSMNEAMFRFVIENDSREEECRQIVSTAFFLEIIGVTILAVPVLLLHYIFHIPYVIYIWIYVFANVLYMFSTYFLRGIGKVKMYSCVAFGKTAFQLILNIIVIVVLRWGLQGMLFALCISEIISFCVVFVVNKVWTYIRFSYFSKLFVKSMLKYSIPLIPNTLGNQAIHLSDRLIISLFMGTAMNGIYSIAYKFPSVIEVIYNYFYLAWSENASQVLKKGKEEAFEYYKVLHEQIDNFVFSVVIMMVASAGIIFQIFIKGDYTSGYLYMPILTYSMYFDCMAKFYSGIFAAFKDTKIMASSTVKAALINLILNTVLILKFGLYAAAISTLIAEIVLYMSRRKGLKKEICFEINYKKEVIKILVTIALICLYSYDNYIYILISFVIASLFAIAYNKEIIAWIINSIVIFLKKRKNDLA